jgi:hypothetical protein
MMRDAIGALAVSGLGLAMAGLGMAVASQLVRCGL